MLSSVLVSHLQQLVTQKASVTLSANMHTHALDYRLKRQTINGILPLEIIVAKMTKENKQQKIRNKKNKKHKNEKKT